jgi:hypothetical protein
MTKMEIPEDERQPITRKRVCIEDKIEVCEILNQTNLCSKTNF